MASEFPSGLPDGILSNQKSQLGKFRGVLAIWYILVYLIVIWYIFSHFGILYQEKSGNPGFHSAKSKSFYTDLIRWTEKQITFLWRGINCKLSPLKKVSMCFENADSPGLPDGLFSNQKS
jgi:hypothetical protein